MRGRSLSVGALRRQRHLRAAFTALCHGWGFASKHNGFACACVIRRHRWGLAPAPGKIRRGNFHPCIQGLGGDWRGRLGLVINASSLNGPALHGGLRHQGRWTVHKRACSTRRGRRAVGPAPQVHPARFGRNVAGQRRIAARIMRLQPAADTRVFRNWNRAHAAPCRRKASTRLNRATMAACAGRGWIVQCARRVSGGLPSHAADHS